MEIRKLTHADCRLHQSMSQAIVAALPCQAWLIPMTDVEYERTFGSGSRDVVFGVFEKETMIATSSMLHDVSDYESEKELTYILTHRCVEIGECMVSPLFRGIGLMLRLNRILLQTAHEEGVEYILATAHPDNIASNTSLRHLGLKFVKTFDRRGYKRNLYAMGL